MLRHVNAVNHGEFEKAVKLLIQQANTVDAVGPMRASALAIQRCRRGGKTFMLHAVASMLVTNRTVVDDGIQVLFISMNSTSAYNPDGEDAYTAILPRVGWEICGRAPKSFNASKINTTTLEQSMNGLRPKAIAWFLLWTS
jgi:hypothetical protein